MKTKLITLLAGVALVSPAFSATYTVDMAAGADANGIQDSLGRAFRGGTAAGATLAGAAGGTSAGPGIIGIGIFSTDNLSELSSSSLVSSFTSFGGVTTTFSAGGGSGARGLFTFSTTAAVTGNSTFLNKNMYLFAGNGATFAASTEFFVLKSNTLFLAADDSVVPFVQATLGFDGAAKNGTLRGTTLFGSTVADMKTTSTDATVTPGFRMAVAVPEPSAALLGAIGALGLLRRRRN